MAGEVAAASQRRLKAVSTSGNNVLEVGGGCLLHLSRELKCEPEAQALLSGDPTTLNLTQEGSYMQTPSTDARRHFSRTRLRAFSEARVLLDQEKDKSQNERSEGDLPFLQIGTRRQVEVREAALAELPSHRLLSSKR